MGKKTEKRNKKVKWWMVALVLVVIAIFAPSSEDEEVSKEIPTSGPTVEATFTPTSTPEPTNTPKPAVTNTPIPTATSEPTETPVPTVASKPTSGLEKIIGNKNTNKYHTRNCGYLPEEENRIYFDSVEDAEAAGMTHCGRCK